jgi:hypothetical protein
MKKLFFLSLCVVATTGFADNLVLENQTPYPMQKPQSKMAVQWANSAKEVDEGNHAVVYGGKWDSNTLQTIHQSGKIQVSIPNKAEYFRVLAWSKGEGDPDFVTNWVEVTPNKTYTLKEDHLVPAVLMSGTGC